MVLEKEDKVKKYIGGLSDNIQGNVIAAEPIRLQDVIRVHTTTSVECTMKGRVWRGVRAPVGNQTGNVCYECRRPGHYRNKYPKLKNQNRGNKTGNKTRNNEATARAYAIGGGGAGPNSNIITGRFLLNNRYATMLFDSGADRSFVSTTFSTFLDVIPSTLDTSYAVELGDGRISKPTYYLVKWISKPT
nr:hypothetical protein [Tanacetum cinerariifolium]